jgi:AcrR family transcriptional regulator
VDSRRQILDAGVALVAEQGVRAVSFREVARRAGVSHQTPYHHFGDYRGILTEIAREGFAGLADAMQEAATGARDPMAALRDAGVAYVDFATTHVGHFRVMFQQPLEAGPRPELPEAQQTRAVLTSLAAAAVAAGHGHGMPSEVMAGLCWSTVHGLAALQVEGLLADKAGAAPDGRTVVAALAGLLR